MMQNNFKIAITGGIGSGKSTVSKIIAEQGYNVVSCDGIYKELITDKNFACRLSEEFGDVLNEDGTIDRQKLSAIVFADEKKLQRLNEITHPKILEEALNRMAGEGLFFCEVPLLFEGGYEGFFDNILVVLRNEEERIASVVKRDKTDAVSVKNRIKSQFDYDNNTFEKYYVIHNDGNLTQLQQKSVEVLEKIIKI